MKTITPANNWTATIPCLTDTDADDINETNFTAMMQALADRTEWLKQNFAIEAAKAVYPVGSLYSNYDNSANPATLLGFGTWVAAGSGRVLVGVGITTDSRGENATFAAGATGGEFNHLLAASEMPTHTHTVKEGSRTGTPGGTLTSGDDETNSVASEQTSGSAGGGQPHNNMPPYVAVYIWRRTA